MSGLYHAVLKHGNYEEFRTKLHRHNEILVKKDRVVWGHTRGDQQFIQLVWNSQDSEDEIHIYFASEGLFRAVGVVTDASKDWLADYPKLVPDKEKNTLKKYKVWYELSHLRYVSDSEHSEIMHNLLKMNGDKFSLRGGNIQYAFEKVPFEL